MTNLINAVKNNIRPTVPFLIIALVVAAFVAVSFISIRETMRVSAGGSDMLKDVDLSAIERVDEEVDPFVFSRAIQFQLNETYELLGRELTLTSVSAEPFEAVFTLDDGVEIVFDSEGAVRKVGDHVFKLSQVAPFAGAANHLIRTVLLVGEQ